MNTLRFFFLLAVMASLSACDTMPQQQSYGQQQQMDPATAAILMQSMQQRPIQVTPNVLPYQMQMNPAPRGPVICQRMYGGFQCN